MIRHDDLDPARGPVWACFAALAFYGLVALACWLKSR